MVLSRSSALAMSTPSSTSCSSGCQQVFPEPLVKLQLTGASALVLEDRIGLVFCIDEGVEV